MTSKFLSPDFPAVSHTGVWEEICKTSAFPPRPLEGQEKVPALFLDRDGVIVKEVNYLQDPNDVELITGAATAIATANNKGIPVIMVTNQAGIAYGYFGWHEFHAVQQRIHHKLKEQGAHIDAVFACPFHKKGDTLWGGHPDHEARKPQPGMLHRAEKALSIDVKNSWIVGDRSTDIEAGRNAGLAGGLHVFTGHGSREGEADLSENLASPTFDVRTGESISDALQLPLFRD